MDTQEFLLNKLKEHWRQFGRAIDDLKDSYYQCSQNDLSTEEWKEAMGILDEDFLIVQDHFEALNTIHSLYKEYIAIKKAEVEQIDRKPKAPLRSQSLQFLR